MKSLEWRGIYLRILDQTKLPLELKYRDAYTFLDVAEAIKEMEVRGAPAIGVAAAYGYVLGALKYEGEREHFDEHMQNVHDVLEATRPTAVNLFWALRRMENRLRELQKEAQLETVKQELIKEAHLIAEDDVRMNRLLGEYGNTLVPDEVNILTHCNTGALATVEFGTALGVIRTAKEKGKKVHVYVDETRPCLQGARLTAWELLQENISTTLITDSTAGYLMQQGKVDMVLVGADRIAANGDTANKIGTYSLAVLATAHEIPFYVVAPTATIDLKISSGQDIPVEERNKDEVRYIKGILIAPKDVEVYNPAFDITPSKYITGIITEKGIISPPYAVNLLKIMVK